MNLLEALYESQINVELRSDWDAGWAWRVGAGERWLAAGHAETLGDALERVRVAALQHFPGSKFAKAEPVRPPARGAN
jgi:hypothetical protein